MSLNEEFDELARRKLEEHQFNFQEADWQDARRRIDAQRGGTGKAVWIGGACLLLLMCGIAWHGLSTSNRALPHLTDNQVKVDLTVNAPTPIAAVHTTLDTAQIETVSIPGVPSQPSPEVPPIASRTSSEPPASQPSSPGRQVAHVNIPVHKAKAHMRSGATQEDLLTTGDPADAAVHHAEAASLEAAIFKGPSIHRPAEAVQAVPTLQEVERPIASTTISLPVTEDPRAERPSTTEDPATDADRKPESRVGTDVASVEAPSKPTAGQDAILLLGMKGATLNEANAPATTTPGPAETEIPLRSTTVDSAGITTSNTMAMATTDATPAPVPAPAAAPPMVPERAPWEISIIGGTFSSKPGYSGANSSDWNGEISSEQSFGAGTEIMHMGRNLGIGIGLHYGTYAEQLRSSAVDIATTSSQPYWYLMAVDTAVLVITGTMPGTPPSYTGVSVDTTILVPALGTQTTTGNQHLRDARDDMNSVSYLEVPILLDVHLVQGRWSFGVRGGPMIGLLTGRRGAVPAPGGEGYVLFIDQPFRELTLGYTARAYVRYRFNAAWSVGLEPAIRGQLVNSLNSGDLVRKSTAKGVTLSLSYRLR